MGSDPAHSEVAFAESASFAAAGGGFMLSGDEKRVRQREASRRYRARLAERRAEALVAARDMSGDPKPGGLRESFEASTSAMWWLCDTDAAVVALGRLVAAEVDALMDLPDTRSRQQGLRLCGMFLRVLQALLGTPAERLKMEARMASARDRVTS